jgi:hypothetical protein
MIKYEKRHSNISFASGTSKTSELIILCHDESSSHDKILL